MLTKKQIFLRCLSVVLGLTLGISASFITWHIKDYYQGNSSRASEKNVQELLESRFWEKLNVYFETSDSKFYDNYPAIYNNYGITQRIDNKLMPYFEKYGYTTILSSGLKSNNKFAVSYCVEKICELWGQDLYDKNIILNTLSGVRIDKTIVTDIENEQDYINNAEKRVQLAKSLLDESFSSEYIIKNRLNTRMVWLQNIMDSDKKLTIYDDGLMYTLTNTVSSRYPSIHFASDNTLLINDEYNYYAIYINNSISEYVLYDLIEENFQDWSDNQLLITSVKSSDDIVYADFNATNIYDSQAAPVQYRLSFNLKTTDVSIQKK